MSDAHKRIWFGDDLWNWYADEAQATAAWNTRAAPPDVWPASLPATDAQAMANPKVQALVEALCGLISYSEMGHFQTNDPVQTALDAISALETDTCPATPDTAQNGRSNGLRMR